MSIGNYTPWIVRDTIVGLVRSDSADLSARQLSILLICFTEDEVHSVGDLASRLKISKPAVTRALDRLEQLDLVRRDGDTHDRRRVLVTRTAPGTAYMARLRALLTDSARVYLTEGFQPQGETAVMTGNAGELVELSYEDRPH